MIHPNKEIMMKAIGITKEKNKKGGYAVAAIIVKGDKIISETFTTIKKDSPPINHAEMNALRDAAEKLNSYKLEGCWLYTT
ncbi:nucleoside deaminase, partial [Candidatus Pacearchaeota archaeon]|nr:nucleoside deaminase [Candidatus Pacearchaeota archaeon]